MKAVVAAFNQEKAFSVIVQPVVEPMEHYTALIWTHLLVTEYLPEGKMGAAYVAIRISRYEVWYHLMIIRLDFIRLLLTVNYKSH